MEYPQDGSLVDAEAEGLAGDLDHAIVRGMHEAGTGIGRRWRRRFRRLMPDQGLETLEFGVTDQEVARLDRKCTRMVRPAEIAARGRVEALIP